jgi:hypothetical protein
VDGAESGDARVIVATHFGDSARNSVLPSFRGRGVDQGVRPIDRFKDSDPLNRPLERFKDSDPLNGPLERNTERFKDSDPLNDPLNTAPDSFVHCPPKQKGRGSASAPPRPPLFVRPRYGVMLNTLTRFGVPLIKPIAVVLPSAESAMPSLRAAAPVVPKSAPVCAHAPPVSV